MNKPVFTRTVWLVSVVSLLTDISSEMLYPVMPVYLKSIGFTALYIGILEGFAEAIVGLSKGYFGNLSDQKNSRVPFVRAGYLLSSFSKPLLAFFVHPLWVLFCRATDRLGKGVRTGARDAILAEESSLENKGKVFGLHRGMDTVGAFLGPICAILYLNYYPGDYKNLFYWAFIPAILGVGLTLFLKRQNKPVGVPEIKSKGFLSYFKYWKVATPEYRKLITGFLMFALFNSSDLFLLLMAKNAELTDVDVLTAYVFYNAVYAIFSYPMGFLADKIGMKNTFLFGLLIFIVVYAGFAQAANLKVIYILFFLYGIYAASTEGVAKAWISKIIPNKDAGTALGFFATVSSLSIFLASSVFGLLWSFVSPYFAFMTAASGVALTVAYFILIVDKR